MEINETEKRKNLVMIAATGEWDGIMTGLFKQYKTASPEERQRLGRVIENDISKIGTEFPGAVKHYRQIYETFLDCEN